VPEHRRRDPAPLVAGQLSVIVEAGGAPLDLVQVLDERLPPFEGELPRPRHRSGPQADREVVHEGRPLDSGDAAPVAERLGRGLHGEIGILGTGARHLVDDLLGGGIVDREGLLRDAPGPLTVNPHALHGALYLCTSAGIEWSGVRARERRIQRLDQAVEEVLRDVEGRLDPYDPRPVQSVGDQHALLVQLLGDGGAERLVAHLEADEQAFPPDFVDRPRVLALQGAEAIEKRQAEAGGALAEAVTHGDLDRLGGGRRRQWGVAERRRWPPRNGGERRNDTG